MFACGSPTPPRAIELQWWGLRSEAPDWPRDWVGLRVCESRMQAGGRGGRVADGPWGGVVHRRRRRRPRGRPRRPQRPAPHAGLLGGSNVGGVAGTAVANGGEGGQTLQTEER